MEEVNLYAKVRQIKGKQVSRLRREGWVPGVVYKKGEKNLLLQLPKRDLQKILHTSLGGNVLISLKIERDSSLPKKKGTQEVKTVIIKEIQKNPLTEELLHIDFQQISLTEKIMVNVPLALVGEAVGVKRDGGILEHLLWELPIECLPTAIPEKIEVDISQLEIGQSLYVKDLKVSEDIKILAPPEQMVVTVGMPKEEKVEEKVEELVEPEVIKQKKPEAEETPEKKTEEKK
ncbi:MAG: 50S ribosomal protein L25 [Candidatus Omnitrophica bacterium]|nr:50S ribosomal protein L25 [Candidatus Omnitrophota bacterium]MCM8793105.1 50S ribosomal protein L25 [Candidatus Omnitrophota bacterium]